MPAELVERPLGVACVFSNGTHFQMTLTKAPNPTLSRQLLTGLVSRVFPHGQVDSAASVRLYMYSARRLLRFLHARGFDGPAQELTRAQLAEFWMGCNHADEQHTRGLLASLHETTPVLSPATLGLVQGRAFNPQSRSSKTPLAPYTSGEWSRLEKACRETVAASLAAYRRALTAAESGRDPKDGGWTPENIRWLLRARGPLSAAEAGRYMGVTGHTIAHSWGGLSAAVNELFPTMSAVVAFQLLLGIYTGVVPDGIADLGLADLDWAGENTVLLDYVKGRTSKESLTLSAKAVRLLERWLEYSALLRGFAPPGVREQLWIRHWHSTPGPWLTGSPNHASVGKWIERVGVLGDDGAPLQVHRHRIRTSFQSLRDRKSWFGSGRASIDPNHSPRVEGDNYLTAATPEQQDAVDGIIETAQGDLLRKAQPPMILSAEQTADLASEFPKLVKELQLDEGALGELIGGERDVFLASCADQLASPFGPAGKPCPARPWVCLLCPLAMFAPRHAANLLRMKAFFARQWLRMPAEHFMAVFGPYATRVDEVLAALDRHDPALTERASREIADTDTEIPLRPEEATA